MVDAAVQRDLNSPTAFQMSQLEVYPCRKNLIHSA